MIETPFTPNMESKLFLTDDPALLVLYSQLRQKTLQTLHGAVKVTPKIEWDFVVHNARLYDRMGCDLLGLDLVRNWEFLLPDTSARVGLGGNVVDPLKLLKRRSSHVVQDLPMSPLSPTATMSAGGGGVGGGLLAPDKAKPKPPPTTFEEPDANSLLDSFGF